MKKKLLSLALALALCLGMLPAAAFAAGDFSDVSRDAWYGEAVYNCVDKGYVTGFEDGSFHPGDPITYAQLASMLRGGVYADTSYAKEDFPGQPWWYSAIYTCREAGALAGVKADVVTGDSDVNTPVTRYEMAQIISNVMRTQGRTARPSATETIGEYIADWDAIPAEYQDAVAHCYALGVIKGFEDGSFSGGETLTRAQVCVVMMGMEQAVAGTDTQLDTPETKPQAPDEDTGLADVPPGVLTDDGTVAANTGTTSKTKVAYGNTKYPSLSNVDANTFRKLDYIEDSDGWATYFYDFRDTWYAGCGDIPGDRGTDKHPNRLMTLYTDRQGFYGVHANTNGSDMTYTVYSYLDNVVPIDVQFRTYDDAQQIVLDATPNEPHTRTVKNLKNGPYTLCVWFDYAHEDGSVETVGTWQTVYVSDGKALFADVLYSKDDSSMKAWLAKHHDELVADDLLQDWIDKNGGNKGLKNAADPTVIMYPFKSGTSRYPNDTDKWRKLAHEICPDETVGDYAMARQLFTWMAENLAYDSDYKGQGYRWAMAARSSDMGTAKGFTTWDSRMGKCIDFSNIFAIMCREMGIPCHIVSNNSHAFDIMYLNDRWELVDVTDTTRTAYLGEDNKTFIANAKKFWADAADDGFDVYNMYNFCYSAYDELKVASYEKYASIEEKVGKYFCNLNFDLCTRDYCNKDGWRGSIYDH